MKIISKVLEYLSVTVSIAGIVMFIGLLTSSSDEGLGSDLSHHLMGYGCMFNSAAIYILFIAILMLGICISHSYWQAKFVSEDGFKDRLVKSFECSNSSSWKRLLIALSNLMLVVFLFNRLSYMWSHCA